MGIFVPQAEEGAKYKFEIKTQEGNLLLKAGPMLSSQRDPTGYGFCFI